MTANRNKTSARRKRPRRGYSLLEVAVSVLVLTVAMNVTVKVLGWVGTDRRAADRRLWAVQAASNVLERASALPFDRVSAESVKALAEKTEARSALPGATWEVDVSDDSGAPIKAKRVALSLHWKDRAGGELAPVRLTTWVFRRGAGK